MSVALEPQQRQDQSHSDRQLLQQQPQPLDHPFAEAMADWRQLPQPQRAWAWFRSIGSPRNVVAPMVNQSELAFRLLTRRWGAQLCFTPMIHSAVCNRSPTYRRMMLGRIPPEDRPLVAQFCGNDPEVLLQAARYAEDCADAVDINLGCPQMIAHRGRYGSYLLDDPDLIAAMVETLHKNLKIPVTCKVRLLPNFEDSLRLCKRIEAAGASMLTVHGRTRDCKHQHTSLPDLVAIKRIKQELGIPVILNGGVETLEDVERLLEFTGCDGVMTSEAILEMPRMFTPGGAQADPLEVTAEYLQLVRELNDPGSQRATMPHMFKLLHRHFRVFWEVRNNMGKHMGKNNRRKVRQMGKAAYVRMIKAAAEENGVGLVPCLTPAQQTLEDLRAAIKEAEAAGRDVDAELARIPSWYRRWWNQSVVPEEALQQQRAKPTYMQILQQRLQLPEDAWAQCPDTIRRQAWVEEQKRLQELMETKEPRSDKDEQGCVKTEEALADDSQEPRAKKAKLSVSGQHQEQERGMSTVHGKDAEMENSEPPQAVAGLPNGGDDGAKNSRKVGQGGNSDCGDVDGGDCMADEGYGVEPKAVSDCDGGPKPFEAEVLLLPSAGSMALQLAERIMASPEYPRVYVVDGGGNNDSAVEQKEQ